MPIATSPRKVNLDELKSRFPMESVVSKFVSLERSGNRYVAFCPFHTDKKSKSFVVYPNTQSAYCFGCGWPNNGNGGRRYGDVITFLMDFHRWDWVTTIRYLESQAGRYKAVTVKIAHQKSFVPFVQLDVVEYYHSMLKQKHREYYHSRLLTDETVDTFKLGWTGNEYSIPFWEGEPGNSVCRSIQFRRANGDGPKYLLGLGTAPYIFNRGALRRNSRMFIFFSTLDALLAHQDGIPAVAIPGQNSWRDEWADDFESVLVVPDRNEEMAGYRLASKLEGEVVIYPEGEFTDYNEFRQRGGTAKEFLSWTEFV